jgi:DNA-binding NtrC family response regulator
MNTLSAAAAHPGEVRHEDRPPRQSRRQPVGFTVPGGGDLAKAAATVLVVDEAVMMRGVLANVLRQAGYHVLEATDAAEARRLAETKGKIDLLFLDLSMPAAADRDLALWFRAVFPFTKVLVVSNSLWDLAHEFSISPYITLLAKPFTPPELTRMVRRILK